MPTKKQTEQSTKYANDNKVRQLILWTTEKHWWERIQQRRAIWRCWEPVSSKVAPEV